MEGRHPDSPPATRGGSLLAFFALTYLVTWTSWLAVARLGGNPTAASWVATPIFYAGVFAPGLVALALTARTAGRPGVGALLGRLVQWDVPGRWYVFAIVYMAAIKLIAAVIHRAAFGAWPRFGDQAWYLMLAATLFSTAIGGQAGEELGWRGYALPRMASRFGWGPSGVALGIIWATWHLPLFFWFPTADTYHQSFPLYLAQVTALSVAITWLYAHTRGSLLPVMLMHSAINNTKDIVPSAVSGATDPFAWSSSRLATIALALLWVCAAWFLVRMPKSNLGLAAASGADAKEAMGSPARDRPS